MKGLVIYSPQQPVIGQLAETIYDEILLDKTLATTDEVPENIREYDIIFVGFWMENGTISRDSEQLLRSIEDCNVALFCAMKENPLGDEARAWMYQNRTLLPANNMVLGGFLCQTHTDEHGVERPESSDVDGAKLFATEMVYSLH